MNIQMIRAKHIAAVILLAAIVSVSGITFAAQDNQDQQTVTQSQQPYLTATQSSGTIEFTEAGKAFINDTFLVARNAPTQSTSPAIQAVRGATIGATRTVVVTSTGYNSEESQTDSSPFITANGEHVYWGGVAANFLPFGTKIQIPDYFGDKVFTVNDRMAKRFSNRVDVWFPEHKQAVDWGRRSVTIVVIK